jgi:hypothetical protein
MAWDQGSRLELLRERAGAYLGVALKGIVREYPHMPYFVAAHSGSYRTHREFHPAFYGCFDWHSCVEMHWMIVRLLRLFPGGSREAAARSALGALLVPENIEAEVRFFQAPEHRALERPYGWGWLLTLQHELSTWDDAEGREWARSLEPLSRLLGANLAAWLPVLTYPQRTGVHPNTAFALSRSLDHARQRAGAGEGVLLRAVEDAARRWFLHDEAYPANYEPSGTDFLSAALCEAELMSRVLGAQEFPVWLGRFLPGMEAGRPDSLFEPAVVSDASDSQIGHLHGLNLSRAGAFLSIARRLPAGDPRVDVLERASEWHARASLAQVSGSNYMLEHWLAAYATLLLS